MPYINNDTNDILGKDNLKKRTFRFINSIKATISIGKLRTNSYTESRSIQSIIGKAFLALKDISTINANNKISMKKIGEGIVPSKFKSIENINKYYFFISMLGFIDSKIVKCDKLINYHARFMDNDEDSAKAYYKYKSIKVKMLYDRCDIISELKNTNILEGNDKFLELIPYDFFQMIPLNNHYAELQKYITVPNSDFFYHFTSAYNDGFLADDTEYDNTLKNYNDLYEKLHQCINKNKQKIKKYSK